ncbi:hypothetical protein [Streptomyces sp. CC219B]|nr:hypothetical protein [Streptomyces sp. CC219B]
MITTTLPRRSARLTAAGGDLTWQHADGRFAVTAVLPADGAAR